MIIGVLELSHYDIVVTGIDRMDIASRLVNAWPAYAKATGADEDYLDWAFPTRKDLIDNMQFWDTTHANVWISTEPLGVFDGRY